LLRWLVIGVGDIAARRVLPAILAEPRSTLVGLVTRDAAKAAPYGVPSWSDPSIALAQSGADAVYIATPVFLHAPQTIAALRAGLHVLCEKPMALDYAGACSMRQAALECGRILGISYYRRLYPKVARAKALLEAGVIGRPFLGEATSHGWVAPEDDERAWLFDPVRAGGGPLYDIACHRIDLMNFFFGRPLRATAHLSTLVQPIPVEDNATVLTEHETGVRGLVDVRWHSHVVRDEFRIRGTDGEMDLTPLNGPTLRWPGGEEQLPAHPNLHNPCIHDFVNAVLDGAPLASPVETALLTEWVIAEAGRS